jgi:acyl carrier protein
MSHSDLLPGVQDVFRDVFDEADLVIDRRSDSDTLEDWDSMTHVNLIVAIEKRYKVKFALAELQSLKNVGDLLDVLEKKLDCVAG